MRSDRWVMAYECDAAGCRVTDAVRIEVGEQLTAGRAADVALGVEVANPRISRRALTVTATSFGWRIAVTNRNGGVLRPWAQPPELAGPEVALDWPLVAVRVPAEPGATRHWVLLESEGLPIGPGGPQAALTDLAPTYEVKRPNGLTPAEDAALRTVFAAQLAWPPHDEVEPRLLKQAAPRLGIAVSTLQDRLHSAQKRARDLGMDGKVKPADPRYLYLLVRAGYLAPPTAFPHRPSPQA